MGAMSFSEIYAHYEVRNLTENGTGRIIKVRGAKTFSEIMKHNPYHGPDGRFTTAVGGGFAVTNGKVSSGSYAPDKKVAAKLASAAVTAATAREPEITKTLTSVAAQVGATMVGLDFRVKTEESLKRKIISEQRNYGIDGKTALSKMRDIH